MIDGPRSLIDNPYWSKPGDYPLYNPNRDNLSNAVNTPERMAYLAQAMQNVNPYRGPISEPEPTPELTPMPKKSFLERLDAWLAKAERIAREI